MIVVAFFVFSGEFSSLLCHIQMFTTPLPQYNQSKNESP